MPISLDTRDYPKKQEKQNHFRRVGILVREHQGAIKVSGLKVGATFTRDAPGRDRTAE